MFKYNSALGGNGSYFHYDDDDVIIFHKYFIRPIENIFPMVSRFYFGGSVESIWCTNIRLPSIMMPIP